MRRRTASAVVLSAALSVAAFAPTASATGQLATAGCSRNGQSFNVCAYQQSCPTPAS